MSFIGTAVEGLKRYHDQTWLTSKDALTNALGAGSDAAQAQLFLLDAQGRIVIRPGGDPTPERFGELCLALQGLR